VDRRPADVERAGAVGDEWPRRDAPTPGARTTATPPTGQGKLQLPRARLHLIERKSWLHEVKVAQGLCPV